MSDMSDWHFRTASLSSKYGFLCVCLLLSAILFPASVKAQEALCEILEGYTDVFLPMPQAEILASTIPPQGAMMPLAGSPFMFGVTGDKAQLDMGDQKWHGLVKACVSSCASGPFYVIWDRDPAGGEQARAACRMAVGTMANTAGVLWNEAP